MFHFFRLLLSFGIIFITPPVAFAQTANPLPPAAAASEPALHALLQRLPAGAQENTAQLVSAAELRAFYRHHDFRPVWQDGRRQALIKQIEQLADDGLQPQDYALAALQDSARAAADPLAFDLLASSAYLQALRHLQLGLLSAEAAPALWSVDPLPAAAELFAPLLDKAAQALDELDTVFEQARPQNDLYQNLRARHLHWQQNPPHWQALPTGATLRPGMRHARVAALRQRLLPATNTPSTAPAEQDRAARFFDPPLVEAVKTFQRHHSLNADGSVGPATLAALNVTPAARLQQIRLNLERLRALSHYRLQQHPHSLLVNIASAMLRYYNGDQVRWQARVQVGRKSRRTPQIYSNVTRFTLNPTWTVPPNIFKRDKVPEIRADIEYLQRQRMTVLDRQGRVLDPNSIDWEQPGAILLRQAAGRGNALGQVVLRFINPYSIYLHDTPSQHLFGRDLRTTSSGCVRVKGIMELIEQLIADTGTMPREALYELLGKGKTRQVDLLYPVPILLAYWSAEADAEQALYFYPDPYHLDSALAATIDRASKQAALHLARIQALLP